MDIILLDERYSAHQRNKKKQVWLNHDLIGRII